MYIYIHLSELFTKLEINRASKCIITMKVFFCKCILIGEIRINRDIEIVFKVTFP